MARIHPVQAAAEQFVSIGGRLMISPRGRFITAIDAALLLLERPGVEERRKVAREFDAITRPKGSTRRLRSMVKKRGDRVNGWLVLTGHSARAVGRDEQPSKERS